MNGWLGIDVSKAKLDVMLVEENGKRTPGQFDNTRKGHNSLRHFLEKRGQHAVHVCLEATGHYGDEVALFLAEAGYTVSVVNPAQIKHYGDSQLRRTKTDASDAALIADFCRTQHPPAWQPPAPEVLQLQALMRHLEALKDMRLQEHNRLQAGIPSQPVLDTIQQHIAFLDAQIRDLLKRIDDHFDQHPELAAQRDLLTSIPGIGDLTAARLLAELTRWSDFTSPKQVAAFAGLSPRQHLSGSSVRARSHISKRGSPRLRAALYMPALVAKRRNPVLKVFAQRLLAAGKPKMAVVAAVMRKLLLLAFAILKSGRPFDPHFAIDPVLPS
jgi:transposase